MRNLGLMGEYTFSLWCADAGLFSNGSQVDKTGWDFFVEFPFDNISDDKKIHKSAIECKVQVKATDKKEGKLAIKLSNLRRLITAQMPAFFVFIEFDNKSTAQRAFIVHVDKELIKRVLENLHSINQSDQDNKFNKRTMTIHYGEDSKMANLNGECLKESILGYIGDDMASYISEKMLFLQTTGFENGFSQITFTTEGEENLEKLVFVSLGMEDHVNISVVKAVETRFGISNKSPSLELGKAFLAMPDLKPLSGCVIFKEHKLSPGLMFPSNLFVSPLNSSLPEEYRKIRVQGEFFDLVFNPYTGSASYSFSLGEGVRMTVKKFRDAVKLVTLLSNSGTHLFCELKFENFPTLKFKVGSQHLRFDLSKEIKALDASVKLVNYFERDDIYISLEDVVRNKTRLCQFAELFDTTPDQLKIEFTVDDVFDPTSEAACIFIVNATLGNYVLGIILVVFGQVEIINDQRFRLVGSNVSFEEKIITEKGQAIDNNDLVAMIEKIEEKYDPNYSVVTIFEKNPKTLL